MSMMLPDVSGNALPGRAPDLHADLLDRHHQRIAEQHGPWDRESELGSCLTVSRYSTRIVIGCAGNETRAERLEQSGCAFALLPFALATTSKRVSCWHSYWAAPWRISLRLFGGADI
jgi:hypothetical protein